MKLRVAALIVMGAGLAAGQTRTIASAKITGPDGKHLAHGTITLTVTAPFQAADGAWVETSGLRVPVVNGAFSVALEPNTNGTQYLAQWQLDGAKPRTDRWQVPAGDGTLGPGDVTVAAVVPTVMIPLQQLAQGGAQTGQAVVWSGSAWVPAWGNGVPLTEGPEDGQYLRWNSALVAWQPVTFVDQETPAGSVDGVNVTFTLTGAPAPTAGLVLFRNGVVQASGIDYTIAGNTVTFVEAATPQVGDTLLAWYRY